MGAAKNEQGAPNGNVTPLLVFKDFKKFHEGVIVIKIF